MKLKKIRSQAGFGIVESMLAALILLFVLSSGFLLLDSVLVNIALENKKDEIANILDERVSVYRLTGTFDDSPTKDGIEFKKTVTIEQGNDTEPEKQDLAVNKFKRLSALDIRKMARKADEKAAKDAEKDVEINYKIVNIAAFDDKVGVAERVKIFEREVKENASKEI